MSQANSPTVIRWCLVGVVLSILPGYGCGAQGGGGGGDAGRPRPAAELSSGDRALLESPTVALPDTGARALANTTWRGAAG